jgi:tRNA/rRNA methyltransferase
LQNVSVVLVATRNPLNMGAAARAMSNFGLRRLRVVRPYEAAFREARSAVGAEQLLANAEEHASVADAVADCTLVVGTTAVKAREVRHPLLRLQDAAPKILAEARGNRSVAVLFGSEKRGLSNEDLSHCHWLLHVPTSQRQPSMNLGHAVAVCLYELARDVPEIEGDFGPRPASSANLERLTGLLLETLERSGHLGSLPAEAQEETLRRMVRRMAMSEDDAFTWLGMLRQILWKLKSRE